MDRNQRPEEGAVDDGRSGCYRAARARIFRTEPMPFLVNVLRADVVARTRIQRFSSGKKTRLEFRLGSHRRSVCRLEWDTLKPLLGPTPVKSHRFDISGSFLSKIRAGIVTNF